ncbi:palmitoyltransferase akr1 [Savitreella phatthalungensis]
MSAKQDIFTACQYGDRERVLEILQERPEAALDTNDYGATALHWAAINGHHEICSDLLARGAQPNHLAGDLKATPLMWAAKGGQVQTTRLLLLSGADASLRDGQGFDILTLAVHSNSQWLVLYLLSMGLPIDSADPELHTALMWACYGRNPTITRILLHAGADISARDNHQLQAIHWAAVGGDAECIVAVASEGADLHAVQDEGFTPATLAHRAKADAGWSRALEMLSLDEDTLKRPTLMASKVIARRAVFLAPFLMLPVFLWLLHRAPIVLSLVIIVAATYGVSRLLDAICNPGPNKYAALTETSFFAGVFSASAFWTSVHWFSTLLASTWPLAPLESIVFTLIFAGAMYNYVKAMRDDPGYVARGAGMSDMRRSIDSLLDRKQLGSSTFCLTCMVARPDRSRHCRLCGRCVIKQDHHCPWIGRCVGRNNHKAFFLYILLLGLGIPMLLQMQLKSMIGKPTTPTEPCSLLTPELCATIEYGGPAFLLVIWDTFQLSWVYMLVAVQAFQIGRGITTQEVYAARNKSSQPDDDLLPAATASIPPAAGDPAHIHGPECAHGGRHAGSAKERVSFFGKCARFIGLEQAMLLIRGGSSRARRRKFVNPYDLGSVSANCAAFWNQHHTPNPTDEDQLPLHTTSHTDTAGQLV